MRFPFNLRYLHEKSLPRLPLWYPDNPKPKIFLPLYWVKLVEPRKKIPENFVKFECHWQMSSADVKQYLNKLYNVSIIDVRIEIEKGKYMKHPKRPTALSPPLPDQKFAYVQLKNTKFSFPNLFDNKEDSKMDKELKTLEQIQNKIKNSNKHRLDIGCWFS